MPGSRTYLTFRLLPIAALALHLIIRLEFPAPTPITDLVLFNFIALSASLCVATSPLFNPGRVRIPIAMAIGFWAIGSTISTWNSFYSYEVLPWLVDALYLAFYPMLLFGITNSIARRRNNPMEFMESIIVALGISGVLSAIFLKSAMQKFDGSAFTVFLSIIFPIGDLVMVASILGLIRRSQFHLRTLLLLIGATIFAITDLYFLWESSLGRYSFAAITDDGWLLGLVLISQAMWVKQKESAPIPERSWLFLGVLTLASTVLILAALKPGRFPLFVLLLCFAAIALSFLRLILALRLARSLAEHREAARIDELTGLTNRRGFIASLDELLDSSGTLLLLDLDGFKKVNDSHGHLVGDQLLKSVAKRFSRAISMQAQLARLGGDEFGVVVLGAPDVGLDTAMALRATLSYPIVLPSATVSVGVSIGSIYHSTREGLVVTREDLLRKADGAMYQAKRGGLGIKEEV